MAKLLESEAHKLAIVFEESWAYDYRENKKLKQQNSGGTSTHGGVAGEWEEVFSFGEDDDSDYWDRPDITRGEAIAD